MNLLWGSYFERQARQNFRQALFRLRRTLGKDALVCTGDEISLAPNVVSSDVGRFQALVQDGGRHALTEAIKLYGGRLLPDLTMAGDAWSNWVNVERQRLESLAMDAMTGLGEQELALGNADEALRAARLAVAIDRLREDAHRVIIRALHAKGRRANALSHFEELISTLRRELDVGPDADTVELAEELRRPLAKTARTRPSLATTWPHRVDAKNRPNVDWHASCRLPKWHR